MEPNDNEQSIIFSEKYTIHFFYYNLVIQQHS